MKIILHTSFFILHSYNLIHHSSFFILHPSLKKAPQGFFLYTDAKFTYSKSWNFIT